MRNLKRDVEDIERFEDIVRTVSNQGFGHIFSEVNLLNKVPFTERRSEKIPAPERLRETFEKLGPTFIKFGQILAERPDLIPPRYAKELQKLQDDVPQFDPEEALSIIDEEVGQESFSNIEKEPLAAASIAQVHRATLKDGEEVIVKVRRPGIKEEVNKDLDIMIYLAKKAEKHSGRFESIRIEKLVREFANWTRNELDLKKECQNAQIFKSNLDGEENIYVPEVYPELNTEKILVMEYIDGVKCTDLEKLEEYGIDSEKLARTALKAGMKQVISDGFFHADPHPSNFLIQKDGTFTYLDFGMMGEVTKDLRNKVGLLLLYTLNEDAERVMQVMQDIGYTEDDADLERIEEIINHKILKLRNTKISQTSISKELLDLVIKSGQNGLHLPMSLTLMGKNLITIEGIGMNIYPDFEISDEYKRIGEELLMENNKPEKLFKETMLDLIENKDMLTHPASQIKKAANKPQEIKHEPVETDIEFELLTPTLILSSTALIAAGAVVDQRLLYIGLAQLTVGILLYIK